MVAIFAFFRTEIIFTMKSVSVLNWENVVRPKNRKLFCICAVLRQSFNLKLNSHTLQVEIGKNKIIMPDLSWTFAILSVPSILRVVLDLGIRNIFVITKPQGTYVQTLRLLSLISCCWQRAASYECPYRK